MNKKDKPAFPIGEDIYDNNGDLIQKAYNGLTKREYFAAMAMQGLVVKHYSFREYKNLTEEAVKYADSLLEELNNDD